MFLDTPVVLLEATVTDSERKRLILRHWANEQVLLRCVALTLPASACELKLGVRHIVVERAVQGNAVARVEVTFRRLQPVALQLELRHVDVAVRHVRKVEFRKRRLPVLRPHVREHYPARFRPRVGRCLDLPLVRVPLRRVRQIDALARHVLKLPAVVDAAIPVPRCGRSRGWRRDAAESIEQADAATAVAEGDQVRPGYSSLDRHAVWARQPPPTAHRENPEPPDTSPIGMYLDQQLIVFFR